MIDYSAFAIPKPVKRQKVRKPLKSAARIKPKPRKDSISTDLRNRILRRDGCCFAFKVLGRAHVCNDLNEDHSPYELGRLTYEHVKWQLRMGKRAEPDEFHAVALCRKMNVEGTPEVVRQRAREYLRELHGRSIRN